MAESSTTINRYSDNKYYLRGFSRHGDFTTKEARLLECHGYTLSELNLGRREPVTEEEKPSVAVCRGERESITEAECVWSKYMTRVKRPKRFHTLSGGKSQVEGAEDYTEFDD